ncbi:MAG: hypothetical protein INQ03_22670 [Candidatus Heimdallarchaeota archaeon]|nr:hypothetical protein [Candidatus Heimdallarchaeota archaeon]
MEKNTQIIWNFVFPSNILYNRKRSDTLNHWFFSMKSLTNRIAIILVFLVLLNPITNAQMAAIQLDTQSRQTSIPRIDQDSNYPGYFLDKKIAIIYTTSNDAIFETAIRVYHSAEMIYHNIEMIEVDTWDELEFYTRSEAYFIKLYFIEGTLDGLKIDGVHEWKEFADLVKYAHGDHILGSGSTNLLLPLVNDSQRVHVEGSDIIDSELSYFYNLWEIGEVLAVVPESRYRDAADDFRILGIEYFSRNMNSLINAQITPESPLGEEDTLAKERAFDEHLEAMKDVYQVLPNGEKRRLDDISTPVPQTSLMFQSQIDAMKQRAALGLDDVQLDELDFSIADIPLFSGLEGPSASIIDTLLEILIKLGGSKLGLSPETANEVVNIIKTLVEILSSSGGDGKESLKDLLVSVTANAPIPEKFKGFIPMIVDSFYLLRGETQDVVDFGSSAISGIFGLASGAFNSSTMDSILGVLQTVLLNGVELAGRIDTAKSEKEANGESFELISEIQGFFMEKILNFSTIEFLTELLADRFPNVSIATEAGEILGIVIPLIKAFVTRDYDPLFAVIPDTIAYIVEKIAANTNFGFISFSSEMKSGLETLARMFQTSILLYNEFSNAEGDLLGLLVGDSSTPSSEIIRDLLAKLIESASGFLGISGGLSLDQITNVASDLFSTMQQAVTDGVSTFDALRDLLNNVLNTLSIADANAQDLLASIMAIFGSIMSGDITNPTITDLLAIVGDIIQYAYENSNMSTGSSELINSIISQFSTVVETVFGILAITKTGGAAQMLFATAEEVDENGELSSEGKNRIFDMVTNSTKNLIIGFLSNYLSEETISIISTFSDLFLNLIISITSGDGQAIKNIFQSLLLQAINIFISKTLGIDGSIASKIILNLFGGLLSGKTLGDTVSDSVTKEEVQILAGQALDARNASSTTKTLASVGISLFFGLKDMFTNTLDFIYQQLIAVLTQFLTDLIGKLTTKLSDSLNNIPILQVAGSLPFKGASFVGLEMTYDLNIAPNLIWDNKAFVEWMLNIIFKGATDFELDVGGFFQKLLSFLSITPIFSASLSVSSMSSGKGGLFSALLGSLGADLSIQGEVHFILQLLSFKAGAFDTSGFVKLREWGLSITITISRDFTLFDVVTAGAGGGALNKAAKYIGLQTITLTVFLSFGFEIIQIMSHDGGPAQGTLTLAMTLGASIYIGISLAIVGLGIRAGIDITLTFIQDLTGAGFKITLDILFWCEVILEFLFWDWSARFEFRPPGSPYDLTPKNAAELKENAFGYDGDGDGLADSIEDLDPSVSASSPDTDGDGLNDKFELKVSKTDPSLRDTDADGLSDFLEWMIYKTNVHLPDTDFDGLTDSEEVALYGTNPLSFDTDADGLTDYYEVTTAWNITGITPSVFGIVIGKDQFDDHTDPTNPDTDGDGLLDGDEGEFGNYFGDPDNYPETSPDPLLLFNGGYTHPLDNDTDDDSYAQYYTGEIAGMGPTRVFLRDMTDGVEIAGITATTIEIDEDGIREYVTKTFFTNPTNPDSDGDTVTGNPRTKILGAFLNSDGYELALDPASDPLNADSDGDGLLDGLEGTLKFDRNATTDKLNPDSDGDGLADGLEYTLGSNPGDPDTDGDLVLDGDEFFIYNTNPFLPDTDFDGVSDGWELFFSHSSPHSRDSDGDALSDYEEIYIYGTNPMDEDSDNDNLTDRDEVLEFGTDANNADSDEDGLRDGPEIMVYRTDPNNPDSDGDSILWLNEFGEPTFLWTDGMEVAYGSDPLSMDSDNDGLKDSWELYLATGNIPGFRNIALDVLNNDTDGDGMRDGQEVYVNMTRSLIYPYVAFYLVYPYQSSPVLEDTDGDGLDDKYEVDNNIACNSTDADGDGLNDFDELFVHLTSPTNPDTDGDGINDNDEVTAALGENAGLTLSSLYAPNYATSATDPDSDKDGWPDGLEVNGTDGNGLYNPYVADVNENGIPDGYERDYDYDGISDGDEYYTYNTYGDIHGGFLDYRNPDSDSDGLIDSDEILEYNTMPFNPDTDFDTYTDSLELFVGTDPLVFNTRDEFLAAFQLLKSPVFITSPEHGKTYTDNTLNVEIESAVKLRNATFRYRIYDENSNTTLSWSEFMDLEKDFNVEFGTQKWSSDTIEFDNGTTYILEVYAIMDNYTYPTGNVALEGAEIRLISIFSINKTLWFGVEPKFYFIGGGALVGGIMLLVMMRKGVPSKFRNPFKNKGRNAK